MIRLRYTCCSEIWGRGYIFLQIRRMRQSGDPWEILIPGEIPNVKPISKRPCCELSRMALTFGVGQPERIFLWGQSSTTLVVCKGTPVSVGCSVVGAWRVAYLASPYPVTLLQRELERERCREVALLRTGSRVAWFCQKNLGLEWVQ